MDRLIFLLRMSSESMVEEARRLRPEVSSIGGVGAFVTDVMPLELGSVTSNESQAKATRM